jgi:hypothetical protein
VAIAYSTIASLAIAVAVAGPLVERPAIFLAAYVAAGVAWWIASVRLADSELRAAPIWVGAVALRAIAFASEPRTSDDVVRYAWEAEVVLDGASPYAYAPDAPELADLRSRHAELASRVAHAHVPAAYPPLAQAAFAAAAWVARPIARAANVEPWRATTAAMRVMAALADLAALAGLLALLRARGLPSGRALAWAWSPLAAFELAGAGHFDALAIAPWLAALAAIERRERGGGAGGVGACGLIACAAAAKYAPFATLPFLGRGLRGVGRIALTVALAALAFAPLASLRGGFRGVFDGVGRYAATWESANLGFRALERAVELALLPHAAGVARALVLAALAATASVLWLRRAGAVDASRSLLGVALVLAPTLHPWYVAWMLPFLALRSSHAWFALAALAPLAHVLAARWQAGGAWREPTWLWPSLALPFFALLAIEWRARRR